MVDGAVLLGLALVAGGILSVATLSTAAAAVVSLMVLRQRVTVAGCAVALGALALGALRAGRAVAQLDGDRAEVRIALRGPVRCAADGEVVSSPILMHWFR